MPDYPANNPPGFSPKLRSISLTISAIGDVLAFTQCMKLVRQEAAKTWGAKKMLEVQVHGSVADEVPEQRLWRAVLASTVQEWISGPLRKKREAEQFLFHDTNDYLLVCHSAGIDPSHFRNRLEKIRSGASLEAFTQALQC
jgi:hypothetical protein